MARSMKVRRGGQKVGESDKSGRPEYLSGRRGSPAPVPLHLAELIPLIASVRLFRGVSRQNGPMRVQYRSGVSDRKRVATYSEVARGACVSKDCTARSDSANHLCDRNLAAAGRDPLPAVALRTPRRGPSFARCLIAIAIAAERDSRAAEERAVAADGRWMEARRVAVLRTPEGRGHAGRTMSDLYG
jgi:hypothetical protein